MINWLRNKLGLIECSHDWETKKKPLYSGVRVCKKCRKIEIWAAKMDWCENYANLTLKEVENED